MCPHEYSDEKSPGILQKPLRYCSHAQVQPKTGVPHGDSLRIESIPPYSGHGSSISCCQGTVDQRPSLVFRVIEKSLGRSCEDENVGFLTPFTS
jgi:hypothetical protein